VFCESSGALVPKDKAVKRFIVRNIVESAAIRDLQESCVFDCARPGGAAAERTAAARGAPGRHTRRAPVARHARLASDAQAAIPGAPGC
jgi:hypothetical protein